MFGNASGIEMMLKSMGLGTVLDAAKELAESGAVQKIIQFADGLEEFNARIRAIEAAVGTAQGTPRPGAPGELVAIADGRSVEPAPVTNAGGGS